MVTTDFSEEEYAFEGVALNELLQSEPQESPVPFARVGFRWDAAVDSSLEIQFSEDGQTWSEWLPVSPTYVAQESPEPPAVDTDPVKSEGEPEDVWLYAGHADVPAGTANFYRLRATAGSQVTFANIELMSSIPEPEPTDESEVTTGSSSADELTYNGVYVNPRSSWGARATRCSKKTSMYKMTIHHTYTPNNDSLSTKARLRQIQSYHMNSRNFCDIGYQFLVSKTGSLWQGRALPLQGAHVRNGNSGNIGVSFIGNHTSIKVSSTRLNKAAALIKAMGKKYGIAINRTTIKSHRERQSDTSCPGAALQKQMNDLVNRAKGSTPTTSIVIDSNNDRNNTSKGYIKVSSNWTGSNSTSGYYGTGYWWRSTAAVSDPAAFYFYLSSAGKKTVDAWWTAGTNRSSAAPFIAYNASGTKLGTAYANQQKNGKKWVTLGSYSFTKGWNKVVLSCWAPEDYVVIADAVRVR
jgi:hypothetical protein